MNYAVEMGPGDLDTKFHIYCFSHSKVNTGDAHTDTQKHTHRQQGDLISLLLHFQNKKSRLKIFLIAF
jgi:hypothetical protein